MRRITLALLLSTLFALVPAHATPQDGGCSIIATGAGTSGCTYLSHGPGAYAVATVSGFRIAACPLASFGTDGRCSVPERVLAAAAPTPATGAIAIGGLLDSHDGDVVIVGIGTVELRNPQDNSVVLRYQDGAAIAHDQPQ
ncbi:MAG: hypothetical protein ABR552_07345 [Actinomycetota bacterium]